MVNAIVIVSFNISTIIVVIVTFVVPIVVVGVVIPSSIVHILRRKTNTDATVGFNPRLAGKPDCRSQPLKWR